MRRIFTAATAFFGLSLAVGMVLPFGGPGGNATSLALAQSLGVGSPFVAELAFPETPWPQGWLLLMEDPDGPVGARIAAEATGADWVLVGKVTQDGWIEAHLRRGNETLSARFISVDLLARWVALEVNGQSGPAVVYEELETPLTELMDDAPHFDPAPYIERLSTSAAELLKEQTALVNGLFTHGPSYYTETLPRAVIDYWQHRQEPEKMGSGGIGPVWKAFYPIANGDNEEANRRALALLASDRALDVGGALLILRATNHPAWKKAAARLTEVAPEMTFGWKELSFAAFEDNDPALAELALKKAIKLQPKNSLYWTNLGWAEYLLGNMPKAIYTSLRGLELEPNPVAAYNLGLFYALLGDYADAFNYYRDALRLDEGTEVQMALKDIKDTGKSEMSFWQGYLLSRSGQWAQAREAFENFLKNHPDHRLAEKARLELANLEHVKVNLDINGYLLGPLEVAPPFGVQEKIRPLLSAEANAYLPSDKAVVRVYDGNAVVAQSVTELAIPPLTAEFTRELEPFSISKPGTYRLVVEYAGRQTETAFDVGPSHLGRQLLSSGIIPVDLDGNPLVAEDVLAGPRGEEELIAATLQVIREAAAQAEQIGRFREPLPDGPFKGRSVAEIMRNVDAQLVRNFYEAAMQKPSTLQNSDAINAFVDWLINLR